ETRIAPEISRHGAEGDRRVDERPGEGKVHVDAVRSRIVHGDADDASLVPSVDRSTGGAADQNREPEQNRQRESLRRSQWAACRGGDGALSIQMRTWLSSSSTVRISPDGT